MFSNATLNHIGYVLQGRGEILQPEQQEQDVVILKVIIISYFSYLYL